MNTAWKFDGTNWTWIAGTTSTLTGGGNYVSLNANSTAAYPCARRSHVVVHDEKAFFFGELGYLSSASDSKNFLRNFQTNSLQSKFFASSILRFFFEFSLTIVQLLLLMFGVFPQVL